MYICIYIYYTHMQANTYVYIFFLCIFIWNRFPFSTLSKLWCLWIHLIYLIHLNFCENIMLILFISSWTWQVFKPIAINATHKLNAQIFEALICKMWIIISWLWACCMTVKWNRAYNSWLLIFLNLLLPAFLFFIILVLSFCLFGFLKPDNWFTKAGRKVIKYQAMFTLWAKALDNCAILSVVQYELFPLTFLLLIIWPSSSSRKQEDPREGPQIALQSIWVLQWGRKARH